MKNASLVIRLNRVPPLAVILNAILDITSEQSPKLPCALDKVEFLQICSADLTYNRVFSVTNVVCVTDIAIILVNNVNCKELTLYCGSRSLIVLYKFLLPEKATLILSLGEKFFALLEVFYWYKVIKQIPNLDRFGTYLHFHYLDY